MRMFSRRFHHLLLMLMPLFKFADAAPSITSSPESVLVQEGDSVQLTCQLADRGDAKVSWRFITHNFLISENDQVLVRHDSKYSLTGVGDTYNLQILTVTEDDIGYYECFIKDTDQSIISNLAISGFNPISQTRESLDVSDCCKKNGVSDSCMPACIPDPIDLDKFNATDNCDLDDLQGLSQCFTDGSNHDNCCLYKEVDPLCLPFCHNEIDLTRLTMDHLDKCYNDKAIRAVFGCFAVGFDSVPGPPSKFTAKPMISESGPLILVAWDAPTKNANTVTGYIVQYKAVDSTHYTTVFAGLNSRQKTLGEEGTRNILVTNKQYKVKILAKSKYGVSFSTVEEDVFIPDSSLTEDQSRSIYDCCSKRKVQPGCKKALCQSKVWSEFPTNEMLGCMGDLPDVFSCLTGEQDHTACCEAFNVDHHCLPLCSGSPPSFNRTMLSCLPKLDVIEACIQQGYKELPTPPTGVELDYVDARKAIISFQHPRNTTKSPQISHYIVQMRTSLAGDFKEVLRLDTTQTEFILDSSQLVPNTYYEIRLIAETSENVISLPSETVRFLTYPENFDKENTNPLVNVPYNYTQCCLASGIPPNCAEGCEYNPQMTAFFKTRPYCFPHIGTVLACGSDGRDHTECCRNRNMGNPVCLGLCSLTSKGPLGKQYVPACLGDTSKAINCYNEGILYLPRHPDVVVSNVTESTIGLYWTQPKTSGLIDMYIINVKQQGNDNHTEITTNKTTYILQDLKPTTAYSISITSSNENGTSAPSPIITVYTEAGDLIKPTIDETPAPNGRALWQNITHCCDAGIKKQECLNECYNPTSADTTNDQCQEESFTMLGCFADGRDHGVCCEESDLPSECLPLCRGHPMKNDVKLWKCLLNKHYNVILNCLLTHRGLVPPAPEKFKVTSPSLGKVVLDWDPPFFCKETNEVCDYTVHYWNKQDDITNKEKVSSPYEVKGLSESKYWSFTVTATNGYGTSPPAPWTQIYISSFFRQVNVRLRSDNPWVEKGEDATLECSLDNWNPADPPRVTWLFNGRVMPNKNSKSLILRSVDPVTQEGKYTCAAVDSTGKRYDEFLLPIKYEPSVARIPPVEHGRVGENAKIACWFHGFPDTIANSWYKDGQPVPVNKTKYSVRRDPRYDTGVTAYNIKVYDVEEADYGKYSLTVNNTYGSTTCQAELQNPDDMININPVKKQADPQKCCRDHNVTSACMKLCSFDIDISEVVDDPNYMPCLAHFDVLLKCGADGRSHQTCCKQKGVKPFCLPFCDGDSPASVFEDSEKLLECVEETKSIFGCVQQGHKMIPYAPRGVITRKDTERKFMVMWSPPEFNRDLVEHYTLYYRKADGDNKTQHISVSKEITQKTINNIDIYSVYEVWVTASNQYGTSHNSNIQTYYDSVHLPSKPIKLSAAPIDGTSSVTITWEKGINTNILASTYNIYFKKANDPNFKKVLGVTGYSYELKDLSSSSEYVVKVKGVSDNGKEGPLSQEISFNTGESASSSGKSDDEKIAIGVGIALGCIAVASLIALVAFLVFRKRSFSPKDTSVAFENPAYKTQSDSVKFDRLEEDNAYDNIGGTAGSDNAYDNPTATNDTSGAATVDIGS